MPEDKVTIKVYMVAGKTYCTVYKDGKNITSSVKKIVLDLDNGKITDTKILA